MQRPGSVSFRFTALVLAGTVPLAQGAPDRRPPSDPPAIRWEEHVGRAGDGSELSGRIGHLTVPERHERPDGPTIELAFVRYATDAAEPGPPLFFLAGGPGGAGIGLCEALARGRLVSLLDACDVIAVDQRGTGRSVPNLSEGPDVRYRLPLERELTREAVIAADRAAYAELCTWWRQQGVDLEAYDTRQSAEDLELVRRALGLETIQLYGDSYGSHLGLAYLRRHAAHVARAVLSRVEGPDHTWKLPSQLQDQLEILHALVAADPEASAVLPDLLGTVRALKDRLAEAPVDVTLPGLRGEPVTVRCGPYELQRGLALLLANPDGLAQAVLAVASMAGGDWSALGRVGLRIRAGGDLSAMTVAMDCASGASPARRERLERELADPRFLLADAIDGFYAEVCDACAEGDVGADFRTPFRCDVPVLFVSGELDARTPPGNVEDLRPGFPAAVHVLLGNAGHPSHELRSPEFCALLAAFVRGEPVHDTLIVLPPIHFLLPQPR